MHIQNTNETDVDYCEVEECYKVVRYRDNQRISVTGLGNLSFDLCLVYTPLERTVPRVGKCFVFRNIDTALEFRGNGIEAYDEEIWYCHGENLQPIDHILHWSKIDMQARDFWGTFKSKDVLLERFHKEMAIYPAPWGTMLSDSVTLVKCLYERNNYQKGE